MSLVQKCLPSLTGPWILMRPAGVVAPETISRFVRCAGLWLPWLAPRGRADRGFHLRIVFFSRKHGWLGRVGCAASLHWRLSWPGPWAGQEPWSSGGRFLFPTSLPHSSVSAMGLFVASPSPETPSSPPHLSRFLLILLSLLFKVVLAPVLEFNTGTCKARLAQAQSSNFPLPGKPGSIFVGTTDPGAAEPARWLLAPGAQRRHGDPLCRHHWIYSLLCVPCVCLTPVCTAVCVRSST